jgi:opacity protein-like surface antigen
MLKLKRMIWCCLVLVVLSTPGLGQDSPRYEAFAGYGYVRPAGGQGNLNGWHASVTANMNSWLGFAVELGGQTGSQTLMAATPGGVVAVNTDASFNSLGFGPRFSYRRNERLTPFAHFLLGLARGKWEGAPSVSGEETSFATALGGGLDARVTEHFSIRMIQAEHVRTRFGPTPENHIRLATGALFSF